MSIKDLLIENSNNQENRTLIFNAAAEICEEMLSDNERFEGLIDCDVDARGVLSCIFERDALDASTYEELYSVCEEYFAVAFDQWYRLESGLR
jgi:hypothetical protein